MTVTPGDGQLTAAWTAPASDGGATVSDYMVEYRTTPPDPWTSQTVTGTSATLTALTNGAGYDVRVAAINAAGTGAFSTAAAGTPRTVPVAPATFAVSAGPSSVTGYQVGYTPATGPGAGVETVVTGFGTGGKVITDVNAHDDYGTALAVQGDGKIVMVGHAYNATGVSTDIALVRYM